MLEILNGFLLGVVDREGILQVDGEESIFPTFIIALEILDTTCVVLCFDINYSLGGSFLVNMEHKDILEKGHGRLNPVASAYMGKTGQDLMTIG